MANYRPRARSSAFGVSRIQRDSYGGKDWWRTVDKIAARDDTCLLCGLPILPGQSTETHHLQRLRGGGVTNGANLARVHKECHETRHSHLAHAPRSTKGGLAQRLKKAPRSR